MGMEIPGRRSAYSLLSQFPDEPPPLASSSDRSLRIPFSAGLQRQSSGSSFGESSLSGDYYAPATVALEGRPKEGSGSVSSAAAKSWAQQAEETYQLQLALALRLCFDASSASDPNLLDPGGHIIPAEILPAESLSHRFWVEITAKLTIVEKLFVLASRARVRPLLASTQNHAFDRSSRPLQFAIRSRIISCVELRKMNQSSSYASNLPKIEDDGLIMEDFWKRKRVDG